MAFSCRTRQALDSVLNPFSITIFPSTVQKTLKVDFSLSIKQVKVGFVNVSKTFLDIKRFGIQQRTKGMLEKKQMTEKKTRQPLVEENKNVSASLKSQNGVLKWDVLRKNREKFTDLGMLDSAIFWAKKVAAVSSLLLHF